MTNPSKMWLSRMPLSPLSPLYQLYSVKYLYRCICKYVCISIPPLCPHELHSHVCVVTVEEHIGKYNYPHEWSVLADIGLFRGETVWADPLPPTHPGVITMLSVSSPVSEWWSFSAEVSFSCCTLVGSSFVFQLDLRKYKLSEGNRHFPWFWFPPSSPQQWHNHIVGQLKFTPAHVCSGPLQSAWVLNFRSASSVVKFKSDWIVNFEPWPGQYFSQKGTVTC